MGARHLPDTAIATQILCAPLIEIPGDTVVPISSPKERRTSVWRIFCPILF